MDPHFPDLLATLQSGVASFLGLPLAGVPRETPGVVLGVPYDGGVLHRPGARMGPWALRQASLGVGRLPLPLRLQNGGRSAYLPAADGWVDGGNLPTLPGSSEAALAAVEGGLEPWIDTGARTFLLGGDHLMTLAALRAHRRRHGPLGLLLLDAHPDAASPDAPFGRHHGTWLRCALDEGLLDARRILICGLRAPRFDSEELSFLKTSGARLWSPADLKDPRLASQFQGHLSQLGQTPSYVSLDLDVLDPAFAPAVAEPVPSGLCVLDALSILDQVHRWPTPWIGADLMETAPTLPGGEESARAGVHLALRLLSATRQESLPPHAGLEDEDDH